MRAVLFHGDERVSVEEVPTPTPGPGEARVRVRYAALCGSEMGAYRASRDRPVGTGHEAVGVVDDPGDTSLRPGQRVALLAVVGCGRCTYCQSGKFPYCKTVRSMHPSHAEYVTMVERNCLPLPDDVDDETAIALFGCGIGVAYHGCRRIGASRGEVVLVVGAGPIGLAATLVLRHFGARPVVADVNPYRMGLADGLGAELTLNPGDEDVSESIRAVNGGLLAAKGFLASGSPDACALALANVEPEGVVATVGGVYEFSLNTFRDLSQRDRSLVGSWHYHGDEFEPLLALARAGLPAAKIITHRFELEQAPEAYRLFEAGQGGKVLLRAENGPGR
jgi:threonine dehydrogenase-like Zn-dependent dehydrogenase